MTPGLIIAVTVIGLVVAALSLGYLRLLRRVDGLADGFADGLEFVHNDAADDFASLGRRLAAIEAGNAHRDDVVAGLADSC